MKADTYGQAIESYIIDAGQDGTTVADIVEAVGCSRQRVYQWIKTHENRVRAAREGENGAMVYRYRTLSNGDAVSVGVGVGVSMAVVSMVWRGGDVELVVEGPDGSEWVARPKLERKTN